ncbi:MULTISPECIES: hypothetical protein [Fischerella]|uniref:Uncharacterized protein n=1 Tax=Fischerella muscicola CCMEE 5323 TaxID=2019572 RepID=A0A2N6JWZ0_FISMU|nr:MULTISPECIES: hypothetical protein [Fischerella]MBD2434234.1 hypothetical protein [Fischerella sp. FACHB-380]PLZ84760.1 hypothetical protein CEN44_23950 [Fischerella muscicola CCMEE 5323]
MDFKSEVNIKDNTQNLKISQPTVTSKPLEFLRDTEALLRRPTVATLVPLLPTKVGKNLQIASSVAEESLQELAEIDLETISDWELRPLRIRIGLSFVGFGALMTVLLLLYLNTLYSQLSPIEQIGRYWHQYVWFVCLGVTGMFILGREAMRPINKPQKSGEK